MASNNQYGTMPMGQGGLIYKGMSKQMGYQNDLMKLQNELAIQYSEVYGDANKGMIAQFLDAANTGADKAGGAVRQDAKNALMQAAIGGAAIVGTISMGIYNYKAGGTIDDQVKDLQVQKDELNAPQNDDVVLQPKAGEEVATPPSQEKIDAKINDWKNGKFDKYNVKTEDIKDEAAKNAAIEESNLNKAALQRARELDNRDQVNEKLDKKISDLKAERSKLDNQFQQFTQFCNFGTQSVVAMATTQNTFDKAAATTLSQEKQAESQVLTTVAQKQAEFISQAKQEAAQDQQAADSIAASYASIRNVQG